MNLLRIVVCGGEASGRTTLAAQLGDASAHANRQVTVVRDSDPKRRTRHLATEAIASDAAVVVVDARAGMTLEAARQMQVLSALGLRRVVWPSTKSISLTGRGRLQ